MSLNGPTDEDVISQRLKALRQDFRDDGFEVRLHRTLVAAGKPLPTWTDRLRRWGPVFWPLSGALAGMLAYVLTATVAGPVSSGSSAAHAGAQSPLEKPGTMLPASKVAVLKLEFTVEAFVEEADFQVSLPEGLVFWADGKPLPERSFSWKQSLDEGSNVVPVAVRGQKPGRYTVSAKARMGDVEMVHDVVLEVTAG